MHDYPRRDRPRSPGRGEREDRKINTERGERGERDETLASYAVLLISPRIIVFHLTPYRFSLFLRPLPSQFLHAARWRAGNKLRIRSRFARDALIAAAPTRFSNPWLLLQPPARFLSLSPSPSVPLVRFFVPSVTPRGARPSATAHKGSRVSTLVTRQSNSLMRAPSRVRVRQSRASN